MEKDDRIALFQQWFSDTIPHNKALGLKVIGARGRRHERGAWGAARTQLTKILSSAR